MQGTWSRGLELELDLVLSMTASTSSAENGSMTKGTVGGWSWGIHEGRVKGLIQCGIISRPCRVIVPLQRHNGQSKLYPQWTVARLIRQRLSFE